MVSLTPPNPKSRETEFQFKTGTVLWLSTGILSTLSAISYRFVLGITNINAVENDVFQSLLFFCKAAAAHVSMFLSVIGLLTLAICWVASKCGARIRGGSVPEGVFVFWLAILHAPYWVLIVLIKEGP